MQGSCAFLAAQPHRPSRRRHACDWNQLPGSAPYRSVLVWPRQTCPKSAEAPATAALQRCSLRLAPKSVREKLHQCQSLGCTGRLPNRASTLQKALRRTSYRSTLWVRPHASPGRGGEAAQRMSSMHTPASRRWRIPLHLTHPACSWGTYLAMRAHYSTSCNLLVKPVMGGCLASAAIEGAPAETGVLSAVKIVSRQAWIDRVQTAAADAAPCWIRGEATERTESCVTLLRASTCSVAMRLNIPAATALPRLSCRLPSSCDAAQLSALLPHQCNPAVPGVL